MLPFWQLKATDNKRFTKNEANLHLCSKARGSVKTEIFSAFEVERGVYPNATTVEIAACGTF